MELFANDEDFYFKPTDDKENAYKEDIDRAIDKIIKNNDRLIFFNVVKEADISSVKIYKYPVLRSYILEKIDEKKNEIYIDKKINRVVNDLKSKNRKISFVTVMNRCKFSQEEMLNNPDIKIKIRNIVITESKNFYKNKKGSLK